MVSALLRDEVGLVLPQTKVFLRDCVDHSIQILDIIESYRELTSSMMDLHVSHQAQRTNEVMKLLTVMSSIFIPLTFLAGVYGMNFDPDAGPFSVSELRHPLGYPAVLGVMLVVAAGLLMFFRRRRWL